MCDLERIALRMAEVRGRRYPMLAVGMLHAAARAGIGYAVTIHDPSGPRTLRLVARSEASRAMKRAARGLPPLAPPEERAEAVRIRQLVALLPILAAGSARPGGRERMLAARARRKAARARRQLAVTHGC
jgi:hypothetical protein